MGTGHLKVKHKHLKSRAAQPAPEPEPVTQPEPQDPAQEIGHELVKRADCANGLYTSPTLGSTHDSLQSLSIAWDSTCLLQPTASSTTTPNPKTLELDIYLYSPLSSFPRIHVWQKIFNSRGSYDAKLMPRWWNSTSSQTLQIIIVQTGQAPFQARYPNGPVFTATYTQPASGMPIEADTNQVDSGITQINDLAIQNTKKSIPGKTAAGLLIPLLFIALGVGAYIRWKRTRGQEKRKKWTEKVDQRMSTISGDWKSVSAAGANAAIRQSMALGSRASGFSSFGGARGSQYVLEDGDGEDTPNSSSGEKRTGVGLRHGPSASTPSLGGERVSRVSFAPDNHPRHSQSQSMYSGGNASRTSLADSSGGRQSMDSNRRTRAFHTGHVPPVPAIPDSINSPNSAMPLVSGHNKSKSSLSHYAVSNNSDDEDDGSDEGDITDGKKTFSPRQTAGALTLTPEDIRARIAAGRARSGSSAANGGAKDMGGADDLLPALSMMRTGSLDPSQPDEYLLRSQTPTTPTLPEAAHPKALSSHTSSAATASPVMPSMPMQAMPTASTGAVMSPDEMLKAYADRKKALAAAASGGGAGSTSSI
ncbi:hypothetical protein CPB83DRAFT_787889, partial [Crepidotus variabilis]